MHAASVELHGVRVGTLERLDETTQDYVFRFAHEWLEDPGRSTLGQLFEERRPDDIRTSGLPCWFDHLLPQGPSRRLFERIARLDEDYDGFDLLLATGTDLPGALIVKPTAAQTFGLAPEDSSVETPADAQGFTLAGAQNKLSIRAGERGLVVPARGDEGSWIAKFDDPSFPGLPTLEFATTLWARASGIRTHEVRLVEVEEFEALPEGLPTGDGKVFLATRFDRSAEGRVHVEDFGQILDIPAGASQYHSRYEDLARVLAILCPEDTREFIERLTFMIISGNGDAHLKNWGVIYSDRRRPRLGPAYDLVATVARIPKESLALSFAGSRSFEGVGVECFETVAEALGFDVAEVLTWVREQRERTMDAWSRFHLEWPFLEQERERIEDHISGIPLLR